MADPLDPVEALRRIAEGECVTTGTVVRIPCVAERCWPCVARAALAALPAPVPDRLTEDEHQRCDLPTCRICDALTAAAPAPEGVPEDRIVPEGMANIGGVTYWAHPTTCGCSYYRAEMMTEGPCVCGHDQDDHDYYDGGCEAPDPHRARLVPLSDTPHEEGEQP